jgi:sugar lactone lactonase YvrE
MVDPMHSLIPRPLILVLLTALSASCASGPPATQTATNAAASASPAAPVATPTRPPTERPTQAASPSSVASAAPAAIDPGDVEPEPPLELAWQGVDPTGEHVPFHPAIAPDGLIWVGVAAENRFDIFDRDGTFIETWGTPGTEEAQINFMHGTDSFGGIAFAADGSFYISESGNRRVQKFNSDRESVMSWGSFGVGDDQFLTPNAIALDAAGNVYVHDDELAATKMFTSNGSFVRRFADGSTPFVSVTDDGHVYAQMWGANLLNEYAPDGTLLRSIGLSGLIALPRAAGIEVDGDGHIWISSVTESGTRDNVDKLVELDEDGKLLHRWDGMAVTQFVLDEESDRLYASFWQQPFLAAYEIPAD